MDGTTTKEDVRIDKDDADELNREAAEDLERIENEVKREAEQYVEAVDGDGNEKESVEAAATATKRSTKTIPLSERNYHG